MSNLMRSGRAWWGACLVVMLWPWMASAQPLELKGRWFEVGPSGHIQSVAKVAPTGGRFRFEAEFEIGQVGTYVVDFKNSSVIHRFSHQVYDVRGPQVAELNGGIGSDTVDPFALRHGRELTLEPGRYRLVTELESPFFLAAPEPYVDGLEHYRQATKPANAMVLVCLGIFLGLGLYYASLALIQRQRVHAMYAIFIAGNLLYNGTALLVFRDLFGWSTFYLVSVPVLFSNIAYVVFVMALLDLRRATAPRFHAAGRAVIGLMVLFIGVSAVRPHWSLEFDRVGVALFLVFGLVAGTVQALRGHVLARWYLVANVGFFVSGLASITLIGLDGVYTVYIEHLGLLAVTIEVVLLAFVLACQFGLLRRDKDAALARAEGNLKLACTDNLTGLPNRYALELEMAQLPQAGSLTFVDLDGLKHYNDHFGHASGDELLRAFAHGLAQRLGDGATLHRLGGDEFAATTRDGSADRVERLLVETIDALQTAGFPLSGASSGSVRVFECSHHEQLKHLADSRMYENKRRRRRVRDASPSMEPDPA